MQQEVQNNHITLVLERENIDRRIERNGYFFAWLASERSKNSIATRPSTELSAYPAQSSYLSMKCKNYIG